MSDERLAEIRGYVADLIGNGVHGGGLGVCVRELLAEVDRLRAPAQLGSALVEARREAREEEASDVTVFMPDGNHAASFVVKLGFKSMLRDTDATRRLSALLAAFPQEDSR